MAVLLFLRRPRELGSYTHLFGLIDAAHVLAGQSRAAEGLLGVLAVTLENLGLQIMGTEHLPGALCSGTGSPALGLCSP